ncbi:MAG: peptidase E [Solirubrobacteraceae bacterium]|jgi:peptidase E
MAERHIVAGSAGFEDTGLNPYQWRLGPVVRYALALAGGRRPKLCWIGTAQGDSLLGLRGFYGATAAEPIDASHLQLFSMPNVDPETHLLGQDVIWVQGGSVVNLLAVWRAHGLDTILRTAWERGVVLAGVSAGSICWHLGGNTDSFGPALAAVTDGLGLLPYSTCVHYDTEPARRPSFHSLIAAGTLPAGYATDDGVAIHYRGSEVAEVISQLPGKSAYRVSMSASGGVLEEPLRPRLLA